MLLLKKLLTSLILPPAGPLLVIGFLMLLTMRRTRHSRQWYNTTRDISPPGRTKPFLALLTALGLLALSLPVVGRHLLSSLETVPVITAEQLREVDAIVILGGGSYFDAPEYGGDTISAASLERLRYGARLSRDSHLPVLVSGGAPFGGTPEGDSMKRVMALDFGIDVRWVDSQSADTADNAAFSATLLKAEGVKRIALVSHAWHLPRAIPLFEAQSLLVTPAPTAFTTSPPESERDWLPSGAGLLYSQQALHEMLGRWVNQWQGKS